jgi:hypothetical protein
MNNSVVESSFKTNLAELKSLIDTYENEKADYQDSDKHTKQVTNILKKSFFKNT